MEIAEVEVICKLAKYSPSMWKYQFHAIKNYTFVEIKNNIFRICLFILFILVSSHRIVRIFLKASTFHRGKFYKKSLWYVITSVFPHLSKFSWLFGSYFTTADVCVPIFWALFVFLIDANSRVAIEFKSSNY